MLVNEGNKFSETLPSDLMGAIFNRYGARNVVTMLVSCLGEDLTAQALDRLGMVPAVSGKTLVAIYTTNHNNFKEISHE